MNFIIKTFLFLLFLSIIEVNLPVSAQTSTPAGTQMRMQQCPKGQSCPVKPDCPFRHKTQKARSTGGASPAAPAAAQSAERVLGKQTVGDYKIKLVAEPAKGWYQWQSVNWYGCLRLPEQMSILRFF